MLENLKPGKSEKVRWAESRAIKRCENDRRAIVKLTTSYKNAL